MRRAFAGFVYIFTAILITSLTIFCDLYAYHDTKYIPFRLDSYALALSFALIGYWIKKSGILEDAITVFEKISSAGFRIAVSIILIIVYTLLAKYNAFDSYVNMADNRVGHNLLVYFFAPILMFGLLITWGRSCADKGNFAVSWICLCGRHSLMFYLGHMAINTIVPEIVKYMTDSHMILIPMVNLSIKSMIALFCISVMFLSTLCLLLERTSASPKVQN